MGFKPRKQATKHDVTNGDTLATLARKAAVTPELFCKFNFGTTQKPEVNRALFEIVGCRTMGADGYYAFSDKDKDHGTGQVLLPQKFTRAGIALEKTVKLTVRRSLPATAAAIGKLDKWFLPDAESCDFSYSLEGDATRANKASVEVYASNYCNAVVNRRNQIRFSAIRSATPVYTEDLSAAAPARPTRGATRDHTTWRGQTTTDKGALKSTPATGAAPAKTNHVNVAFSPYTVMVRYHKADADKDARILLRDFWPQWDDKKGTVKRKTLWVRWRVEKCSRLKAGQILIYDKSDTVVFRKALGKRDLRQNRTGTFKWDGKLADGTTLAQDKMPYRVQVQGHTDMEDKNGVGLAVMHTEVRIYAHKDTGSNPPLEAYKDPNTLKLQYAPFVPEVQRQGGAWVTRPPDRAAEEARWYEWQLARGGYHPGPVDGVLDRTSAQAALREFQRSFPANTAVGAYTRLDPRGRRDAATTAALARLPNEHHAWFGDPANRNDLNRAAALPRLINPTHATGLLVWLDDRNYYTDRHWGQPYINRGTLMRHYHGDFALGDNRLAARNSSSIGRPWIPLMVDIPLLKKDTGAKGLEATNSVCDDTSRAALGPVRVNWTFEEIGEDLSVISRFITNPAHPNYDRTQIRSHRFVQEVVSNVNNDNRLARRRRGKTYTNCPSLIRGRRSSGIRPGNLRNYYREAFGRDRNSLAPWWAGADSRSETVATLVHSDLGQAAARLHAGSVGRAGIYLRLSRAAGDGYRFRAQVGFDRLRGGMSNFPNNAVLKKRYPRLPKADTCKLRLWKKISIKGYVPWCLAADRKWPNYNDTAGNAVQTETLIRDLYSAAFCHVIREPGPNAALAYNYPINTLLNQALFRRIIRRTVTHPTWRRHRNQVTLNLNVLWPYSAVPHLGFPQGGLGTTTANFWRRIVSPNNDRVWDNCCSDIMLAIIQAVDARTGRFKGHLQVQFRGMTPFACQQYRCNRCNRTRAEITANAVALPPPPLGGNAPRARRGSLLAGTQCPRCRRRGTMIADGPPDTSWTKLWLAALGMEMGGVFLFHDMRPEGWTHEIGHNRHMEHSQAQGGQAARPAGFKNAQHDTRRNTNLIVAGGRPRAHNRDWDRNCIMSYTQDGATQRRFFCGKCLLKLRGWGVERIRNPASGIQDP